MNLLAPPPQREVARTEAPTFSIVVAAHNVADRIGDALDSAFAQTVPAHEVIVCDDGSSDKLDAALALYADRIRYLRHDVNRGEAAAKNTAVRAATGEFVVILDADDVFYPKRLETLQTAALGRPDLDLLTTDALFVSGGQTIRRCYEPYWPFVTDDQRRGILERNFIFGLAAVRRERLLAIDGFDEAIRWTTDWDCWIRLIFSGSQAGLIAEPLAEYRLREASLSSDRVEHVRGRVRTLEKAAALSELTARERETVEATLAAERRSLALEEAQAALASGAVDARTRALHVARDRTQPRSTRAKAMIAAAAPVFAGRLARARRRKMWTAPGDIAITREQPRADS
jgi:glycosyltransferase involved in cell wall biosynthesis